MCFPQMQHSTQNNTLIFPNSAHPKYSAPRKIGARKKKANVRSRSMAVLLTAAHDFQITQDYRNTKPKGPVTYNHY